jgi:hypothetical protein
VHKGKVHYIEVLSDEEDESAHIQAKSPGSNSNSSSMTLKFDKNSTMKISMIKFCNKFDGLQNLLKIYE